MLLLAVMRGGLDVAALQDNGMIRLIDLEPYRIPFDDDTFDLVVSEQVLEHAPLASFIQSY